MSKVFPAKVLLLLVATALSPLCVAAQEVPAELRVTKKTPVEGVLGGLLAGRPRCDENGSIYFQPGSVRALPPNTVLRISADGRRHVEFTLRTVPGFEKSEVTEYAVARDGSVYAVTTRDGFSAELVTFRRDGTFQSAVRLEESGMSPRQLAAIGKDSVFVGGWQTARVEGRPVMQPLAAIFSTRGQLLARADLRENLGRDDDEDPAERTPLDAYRVAFDLSIAETGSDGNLYYARPLAYGPVFVISPAGELVRTIKLTPPSDELRLLTIKVSGGRLAAVYQGKRPPQGTAPVFISVVDLSTEQVVGRYFHTDWAIGTALACYVPEEFTFVSADENRRMILVTAAPR